MQLSKQSKQTPELIQTTQTMGCHVFYDQAEPSCSALLDLSPGWILVPIKVNRSKWARLFRMETVSLCFQFNWVLFVLSIGPVRNSNSQHSSRPRRKEPIKKMTGVESKEDVSPNAAVLKIFAALTCFLKKEIASRGCLTFLQKRPGSGRGKIYDFSKLLHRGLHVSSAASKPKYIILLRSGKNIIAYVYNSQERNRIESLLLHNPRLETEYSCFYLLYHMKSHTTMNKYMLAITKTLVFLKCIGPESRVLSVLSGWCTNQTSMFIWADCCCVC